MTELYETFVLNPVDNIFYPLGLYENRLLRFFVVSATAAGIIYYVKPNAMFREDGSERPWALLVKEEPEASPAPFWLAGIAIGAVSAMFF